MVRIIIFFCSLVFCFSEFAYGMQSSESAECTQEIASSSGQCPFCSDLLGNRYTLEAHIVKHLICHRCSDKTPFASKEKLYDHYKKHHKSRARSAHSWLYGLPPSYKENPPKPITEFNCSICNVSNLTSKQGLIGHLSRTHLLCGYCHHHPEFFSSAKLLKHTAKHHLKALRSVLTWHQTRLTEEQTTKLLSQYSKKRFSHIKTFPCSRCPSAHPYSSQQSFFRHLNTAHITCGYCIPAQQFYSPSQLLEHTAAEHENVLATVSIWMAKKGTKSAAMEPKNNSQEMMYLESEKAEHQESPQEDTSQGTICSLNTNPVSTLPRVPSHTSDFIEWLDNYLQD